MAYNLGDLSTLKRNWIFNRSNIPRRFMGMDRGDIVARNGSFPEIIDEWLELAWEGQVIRNIGGISTTGVGLLFDGEPGRGKTTHAVTALMEFVRLMPEDKMERILSIPSGLSPSDMRPIYYLTFPEFLSRKKALIDASEDERPDLYREMEGFHGRAKEDWLNVRVLVLDDLGKEYGSKYDNTSFDEILRARYDKALPTIITTNVNRDNWKDQYGSAMGSFVHEAFHRVPLLGKDLRQK
jgi:DNA replication protein DnaC